MKKILVVDDSKTILALVKNEFSEYEGVKCFYAENYKDAKAIIEEHGKELKAALLDINLPDAPDGEVISLANANGIPVVVLTGTLDKRIREIIQKKEIVSYILKDKPSSIRIAIKSVLNTLAHYDTNILLVDDSKSYRLTLGNILRENNFNIIEAKNGQEALSIVRDNKYNISIVITDYDMPVMDGLDLTIKLRELKDKSQLAILAISGIKDMNIINDFLTFGADDFINKPFTPNEIMARINSSLEILNLFKQITLMANKDYLTDFYNRRYFFESAHNIFLKAKRKKTPLVLAMIDIDNFKNINDTYGHNIGDIALKEVKKVLDRNLRASDLIARFGGEEFAILLEDITKEDAQKLFEKIREDFEKNAIDALGVKISYTVSIGISYGNLSSIEDMIKKADEALYFSKENGRNKITFNQNDIGALVI